MALRIFGVEPPYTGPPRSIMGTFDGEVFPLKSEEKNFESHGSVSGFKPFEFNGQKYWGMCNPIPCVTDKYVTADVEGKTLIMSSSQFYILEDAAGRYELTNGSRFDVFHTLKESVWGISPSRPLK